jgi:hypothetical protein
MSHWRCCMERVMCPAGVVDLLLLLSWHLHGWFSAGEHFHYYS